MGHYTKKQSSKKIKQNFDIFRFEYRRDLVGGVKIIQVIEIPSHEYDECLCRDVADFTQHYQLEIAPKLKHWEMMDNVDFKVVRL